MKKKQIMNRNPIIGIAGEIYHHPQDTVFKNYERHFCGDAFVIKIREAGGNALMVPYIQIFTDEMIFDYISSIDGLMIPGGDDVDPSLYREQKLKECGSTDKYLDIFYIALINEAVKQKKPLLGICRGSQIINVALGGTLYQDIGYFKKDINHSDLENYERTMHNVKIVDNTNLKKILKVNDIRVNSLHHQVIKKIAQPLKANAFCEDGVVEGIESVNENQFILGVQWHPETMKENNLIMNNIFKALIDSCK
jgi:putative glutamine amidotransferase